MFRIGSLALVTLVTCLCASGTKAQDRLVADWMNYLEGSWTWTAEDGATGNLNWTRPAGIPALRSHGRIAAAEWTGNLGWHADKKVLADTAFDNRGGYSVIEYDEITEKQLTGTRRAWNAENEEAVTEDVTLIRGDDARFTFETTNRMVDGKPEDGISIKVSRVDEFDRAVPANVNAWWKFLEGEWDFEIPGLDMSGTAQWTVGTNGQSMRGMFRDSDGGEATELSGWRPDTQSLVARGFGSDGHYWELEFHTVNADVIEGVHRGVRSDGRSYQGVFVGRMVDANTYQWTSVGKASDGEAIELKGTYNRLDTQGEDVQQ